MKVCEKMNNRKLLIWRISSGHKRKIDNYKKCKNMSEDDFWKEYNELYKTDEEKQEEAEWKAYNYRFGVYGCTEDMWTGEVE